MLDGFLSLGSFVIGGISCALGIIFFGFGAYGFWIDRFDNSIKYFLVISGMSLVILGFYLLLNME